MATILIIDDDLTLSSSVRLLLESNGYDVISCNTGNEGYLSAQAHQKPDLIIMDIMMSYDMEGFDLARKLKENPFTREIPIIALSGIKKALMIEDSPKEDPEWFPVSVFLEKPIKPETLLDTVSKWLKSK